MAPVANKVAVFPEQMVVGVAVAANVGEAFTLMLIVCELEQLAVLVATMV